MLIDILPTGYECVEDKSQTSRFVQVGTSFVILKNDTKTNSVYIDLYSVSYNCSFYIEFL